MPSVSWVVPFLIMYEHAAAYWQREVYRSVSFAGFMVASSVMIILNFASSSDAGFRLVLVLVFVMSLALAGWAIRWAVLCHRLEAAVRLQLATARAQIRAESTVDLPLTVVFPDS